jgi:hypothetical protein
VIVCPSFREDVVGNAGKISYATEYHERHSLRGDDGGAPCAHASQPPGHRVGQRWERQLELCGCGGRRPQLLLPAEFSRTSIRYRAQYPLGPSCICPREKRPCRRCTEPTSDHCWSAALISLTNAERCSVSRRSGDIFISASGHSSSAGVWPWL